MTRIKRLKYWARRALLALALPMAACGAGCTPAARAGIPVISTIDAIGMGAAKVLGWCEAAGGADRATYEKARAAIADRDYGQAVSALSDLATTLRLEGADVPDEAFMTLKLIEGALAAHAIDVGMSALSGS